MKVIDGEWRPCTLEERAWLGVVLFQCIRHPAAMGCEANGPQCIRRMIRVAMPKAQSTSYRVRDNRRIEPLY